MSDLREVDSDLMLSSRLETYAYERLRIEQLDHLEVGHGSLPRSPHGRGPDRETPGVLDEPGHDRPAILLHAPLDERRVDPPRLVRLELRAQRLERALAAGEDDEARGVTVEPGADAEPG